MTTYDGLDLFSTGPSRLELGPTESRDAISDLPGAIGTTVINQGIAPRTIRQLGTLRGDTEPDLRSQIDAIETQIGRGSALLIDAFGNQWSGCIMRTFSPGSPYRIGPRYATNYTIDYLQTTP